MSYFKAKMHQIQFRLGLRPRSRWGSLQRSPRPLAEFKGPTSKGREGEGRKGEEEGPLVLTYIPWREILDKTLTSAAKNVHASVCPSVCLSVCLSVRPSVCLSVCLSVRPSVCLCLSVCWSLRRKYSALKGACSDVTIRHHLERLVVVNWHHRCEFYTHKQTEIHAAAVKLSDVYITVHSNV